MLADAKTVFWNGPMGVFELAPFADGTLKVAEGGRGPSRNSSVVGGGDSAAAGHAHSGSTSPPFSHISTGGGASLEYLEGKKLPGLTALEGAQACPAPARTSGVGRMPLIAGNWKMNLNHLEAIALVQKLSFSPWTKRIDPARLRSRQ